jgi:hypothetical protein
MLPDAMEPFAGFSPDYRGVKINLLTVPNVRISAHAG